MAFLRATWIFFLTHLGTTLRSRRLYVCAFLAAAPVLIAWGSTIGIEPHEKLPVALVSWMLIGQLLCPLIALLLASSLVSEEVGDRTITYLFSRPVPRASLLVGRWLAVMVIASALLAGSSMGTLFLFTEHFVGGVASGPWREMSWPMVQGVVLGAAAYAAAFAMLGTLVKYPMIIGLVYAFAFEVLLVNLPLAGSLQEMTVQFHLRSIVKGSGVEAWGHERLFQSNELVPPGDAFVWLGTVLLLALALGSWIISRRQYVVSS